MSRLRRFPPQLGALLAVSLLLGLAWSVVTPPWQAPDENSHFGYVQHLVETGELPGRPDRPLFSTEQTTAQSYSNADQAAAQPLSPMELRPREARAFDALTFTDAQRSDGGGMNPAANNPPLYYLSVAPGYVLAGDGSIFTRLWGVRLFSLLWLVLGVCAAWALGREVLPTVREAPVTLAGIVALSPMVQFLSGSITPDAALIALWTTILWLGARALRRGLTAGRAAALGAALGVAILTKATSYALLPAVGFVLVFGAFRARRLLPVAVGGAAAAAVVAPWFFVAKQVDRAPAAQVGVVADQTGFNLREFGSYLWQYYLPDLPFMTPYPSVAETLPAYDLLLQGSLGRFGWLEVMYPEWVYVTAAVLVVLVLLGLVVAGVRGRRLPAVAVFLALVVLALFGGLHWAEYPQLEGGAANFIQGRYLLPLAAIGGLVLLLAARQLPERITSHVLGAALGGLFVLDVWGLALMLERFGA